MFYCLITHWLYFIDTCLFLDELHVSFYVPEGKTARTDALKPLPLPELWCSTSVIFNLLTLLALPVG